MMYSRLLPALLLLGLAQPAFCDSLSELPANWRESLTAVEEIDISTLLADEQQAILDRRADIGQRLRNDPGEDDGNTLAQLFGNLGNLYQAHGLNTSADACYINANRLDPNNFRWAYYLAYNAHKDGDLPLALTRLQAALALDSEYPPATSRLAQTCLDLNQPDRALAEFRKLLDVEDFRAAGYNGIGQVLLLKQDYAGAVEHFTRALELEPEASQLHYPLAQALRAQGQTELAQSHLKQFADHRLIIPDPLVDALSALKNPAHQHFVNAMTWVLRKQFSKARSEFDAGLRIDPENAAARTSYARALYLDGDEHRARIELEHVLAQDPKRHLAIFLLALLEDAAGNDVRATELYHRVLKLRPDHDGASFFLGNIQMRNRDYARAVEFYDRAISNDGNNLPAHIFRLVAMMGSAAPDRALRDAVKNITERNSASYPAQRIRVLLLALSRDASVSNPELALGLAEQLHNTNRNPLNAELVAMAKAASGDFESAIPLMQQAAEAEQQRGHGFNSERMMGHLADFQNRQLPSLRWTDEIRFLSPPATNPLASFRDYPDANPI